ncbi:multidrug resistance efflux pump [Rivularia sp. PCC 7116]|uniref:HlyD family efflux transporter periplasmic adaptor subunit n=1 Tax=Rivularia sp. PCC 7116 TaxID=373994 RepID=UPI00029EE3E3|nr:HlyD family efflux transporter periplasmic adaptor subunit [Rivularia sp. PCC 7116]AFY57403.1 multidrug resistance efflux pump [Rivularia sp. PCC 7116]
MVSNSQHKFIPTLQTDESLPSISPWTTYGGLFILFVLGATVPISAVIQYPVIIKGQGVIRPDGGLAIVQALTEGKLNEIYVKENQVVKKGDEIATIDDSHLRIKKSQLESNIKQTKLQLASIKNKIDRHKASIKAESKRLKSQIDSAEANFRGSSRAYEDKKKTAASELKEADSNIKIAEKELLTGKAQLKSARATLNATIASRGTAKSTWNRYKSVAKEGALSKDQIEEARLTAKQQEQAVIAQEETVEAQKQKVEQLKQSIEIAKARQNSAQIALNPSNAELTIAKERISQEKAEGEANKAALNKERQVLLKEKSEIEEKLASKNSELEQIENELDKTIITATADGEILKLNLRNPAQTLRGGEEVAQIVPKSAPKIVKVMIRSEDINKVKIDQEVQMRVDGCKYTDYGVLKSKVQDISSDVNPSQNNDNQTSPNEIGSTQMNANFENGYEIVIKPEKLTLGNTKKCQVKSGMKGRVDIITHRESVLKFILRKARLITDL